MRSLVMLLTISGLTLAGCTDNRDTDADPANWFGDSPMAGPDAPGQTAATNPLIPERSTSIFRRKTDAETYTGTPIYAVQNVVIDKSAGGAIVTATGVSLRQGAFDVRLLPENRGIPIDGMLTFTMRAVQRDDTPQGPEQTRRVSAGRFVSGKTLDNVRGVQVLSQTTTITSRR